MQANDDKSPGLIRAALLAVVVALAGLAGAVRIAQSAVDLGPKVGDIILFEPGGDLPNDLPAQVAAARNGQRGCMLNLEALHRDGGSLIVEARDLGPAARYRVHWAGKGGGEAGGCGATADLLLDDANLEVLAIAAGGWGVAHKQLPGDSVWIQAGGLSRSR